MSSEPLLYDEITPQQRTALAGLVHHPGYEVLVMIMNKSCETINARLVKLKPEDPEYEKKLTRLHLQSRTANEFCSSILKSITYYERVAVLTQQMTDEEIRAAITAAEPKLKPGNPLASAVAFSNKLKDGE